MIETLNPGVKYNGRTVVKRIEFNEPGTFKGLYAAERYCDENGYSYGSLCGNMPVAIWKGDCSISKWKNLSASEKKSCDGVMIGEFREGPVTILIF